MQQMYDENMTAILSHVYNAVNSWLTDNGRF